MRLVLLNHGLHVLGSHLSGSKDSLYDVCDELNFRVHVTKGNREISGDSF